MKAVGYPPGYPAGESYDIVRIYAAAIAKTSYSGPAIREFIANLRGMLRSLHEDDQCRLLSGPLRETRPHGLSAGRQGRAQTGGGGAQRR
jgi:hypothetical protein